MVPFYVHIKINDLGRKRFNKNTIQSNPASCLHPVIYLIPLLFPPSTPHLLFLTSAGSVANLRAWAMPTYSLRRARFNTSKCCNASQLTLIIKACASPVLHPPTPTLYTQSTRPGVWASVLTCREQHSSNHHSSSMLIGASWEEINKAIKGDITVCLGPHVHIPPPSLLTPSLSSLTGTCLWGGLVVGRSNWKVSSMRFWSKDETPSLGVGGKRWSGTPDSSGEEVDFLEGL